MQRVRIERSAMIEASFGNFVGVVVDASCSSKSVPKFFDLWGVHASPLLVSQIQERQGTPPFLFLKRLQGQTCDVLGTGLINS